MQQRRTNLIGKLVGEPIGRQNQGQRRCGEGQLQLGEVLCTVWSGQTTATGAPFQGGQISPCQGALKGMVQQQVHSVALGIPGAQPRQLHSQRRLPAGPGPQKGDALQPRKPSPMARDRRQVVAHMAARQQQQGHQGEWLIAQIAQQQLLGRRRRQSAEGLQAHGRPAAALQLGSQRHQLSRQLPAHAAMHHQQQGPGGDGRRD